MTLPTYDDVRAAAGRLRGVAHRTPVLTSRGVNARTGATVFFKAENLQRAGAFKFRGAFNALSCLSPEERARGVVTFSSGNHAQAMALASSLVGCRATIVMPATAPRVKLEATRAYGAEILTYDPATDDREAIGRRLAAERGLTLVPPFDHPNVLAGQGTSALELFEETGPLDVLLVCCGGGGLLSGCALAATGLSPDCRVIGVEPEAGDDGARSFRTKTLQRVHNPATVADGARTPSLGVLTFALILQHVSDMVTVSDDQLLRSMFYLWQRLKTVVEPTGALAAAALLEAVIEARGARVGVILSGGNVDLGEVGGWWTRVS